MIVPSRATWTLSRCWPGAEVAVAKACAVLKRAGGRPGHVFNLGHGLHPDTDYRVVAAVVDAVQSFDVDEARETSPATNNWSARA